jgi:hypothetical protein
MDKYQKVEGHSSLIRDKQTGAILNTNRSEIARARKRKEAKKRETEKLNSLSNEVTTLKSEISEIKELLFRLVENKE